MNRATLRGLACGLVAACGVACSGPPSAERASARPLADPPERAVSPPPVGRAEQRLSAVEERAGPQRALILGPQEVSVTQHTAIERWDALMDGDLRSAAQASDGASLRVRARLGLVQSIRIFGDASSIASVHVLRNDVWQPAEVELGALRGPTDRWRTLALPEGSASNEVEIRFRAGVAPTEIEAWGRVEEQPPARWMAERLSRSTTGFERIVSRQSAQRVSTVDHARDATAGLVVFDRGVDAAVCRRAFVRFTLDGAEHWSQLAATLNGTTLGAPRAGRVGFGGVQIEEIPAALVRAGVNELRFEPVRALDPSGYVVSSAELLCATTAATALSDVDHAAHPLADGDATTAVSGTSTVAQRSLSWRFGARSQAHAVSFRIDAPSTGAIELQATDARMVHRIALAGRAIGWHDVELPDGWPASSGLSARVALSTEGVGSVSELRVSASPVEGTEQPRLVLTWPHAGECVDGRMQIRGFVAGVENGAAWSVRSAAVTGGLGAQGTFALVDVPVDVEAASEIEVRATDGERSLSRWIPVARCASSAPTSVAGRQDQGAPFATWAEPLRDAVLEGGGLRVEIPRGAVSTRTQITARPLATATVQAMDSGMTNVTAGRGAWRLGPSPMRFVHSVKLSFPIDRAALPAGKTEHDVQLFYFDEGSRRWTSVSSEVHDGVVTARTDHFTDWVAATVSNPDSPETSAGDGQSMGALGAGHPLAGVHGASAPTPNSQGTATTTFPIVVPPGRHGLQPSLSLTYDSSTGGSFAGVGWTLAIPSISIDTRFGVPTYSGAESYSLNGAGLVFAERLSSSGGVTRDRFDSRVLTTGLRIVRVQTNSVVTWEVTDSSGTTSYFGLEGSARLSAPMGASEPSLPGVGDAGVGDAGVGDAADSGSPAGQNLGPTFVGSVERTGVWHLSSVIDNFGNQIAYNYLREERPSAEAFAGETTEPTVSVVPSSITYTGHVSGVPAAHFSVEFDADETRPDVAISGRFGFLTRAARKLNSITIKAGAAVVRRYELDYREGDFGKTLLQRVRVLGADAASELFRNEFDYYGAPRDTNGNLGFTDVVEWGTGAPFAMEAGFNNSGGINGYFGIGDPAFVFNAGVGGSGEYSGGNDDVASTDVNGDGLLDFVHNNGNVRLNGFATSSAGVDRTHGALSDVTLQAPVDLLAESAWSAGIRGGISLFTGRGAAGATAQSSWSSNSSMFLDVDGDGRADLIQGPQDEDNHPVLSVHLNPFQMNRGTFGVPQPAGIPTRDYRIGGLQLVTTQRTIDMPPGNRSGPLLIGSSGSSMKAGDGGADDRRERSGLGGHAGLGPAARRSVDALRSTASRRAR